MGVWKNVGWAMIIYLAGLQSIPADLYEASAIEGAGGAAAVPLYHRAAAQEHHRSMCWST